jgi:hypothetical protein
LFHKEVGNIAGAVPGAFGTYGGYSDIGGEPNAYFYVKIGYVERFEAWLETPALSTFYYVR